MSGLPYKLVNARHGRFLANPKDVYIGTSLIAYGEFSELETDMLRQLCRPGTTVVEVGANVGSHTVPLARHLGPTGRMIAVEPQPAIFQNLCANIALNGLGNVETLQKAFGASVSEAWIPRLNYAVQNNFGGISVMERPVEGQQDIKVDVVPLDSLNLEHLHLVKIDAEGMEIEVLKGAEKTIAAKRPLIYLENDRTEKSAALIQLLWAQDYRLWWHLPPLYNPNNWSQNQKNIWPGTVSVNMLCLPKETNANVGDLVEVTSENDFPLKKKRPAEGEG